MEMPLSEHFTVLTREPIRKETDLTPPCKHIAIANILYTWKLHSNYITNHSHFIPQLKNIYKVSSNSA